MENNEEVKVNNSEINENNPKKNNRKTIILIIIAMILVLAIGIGGGFLLASKDKTDNNTVSKTETQENKQEQSKTSKKIDDSKDWVYDADYKKENKKLYWESNKSEENSESSDKDLVVPYININSDDAKTANENIKALYEEWYSKYGTLDPLSDDNYPTYNRYILKYEKYVNDDILSVVITLSKTIVVVDGGAGGGTTIKYIYNFNLDTLNEATLDEMAKECGFASGDEVVSKIEKWENRQEELAKKYTGFIGATMDGVQKGKYFIDSNKKMNFIYKFSAASSGDTTGIVEPNKDIEDFYDENELIEAQKVFENNQATNKTENKSSNISNSNYIGEYIKIIDKVVAEYPDNQITCDLIYFNNDDIPDLVIGLPGYWVSLYIYEKGTVYNPIEEWAYGAMGNIGYDYIEKKAIVSNYNSDYAGAIGTNSIIILNSNNKFDYLAKRGVGADLEPTDEMYEAVQKDLAETGGYYYNDKKISEEEYNNKLKELSIDSNTKFKNLNGSKSIEEVKKQLQQ